MGQLFARGNIAHRHESDLAADPNVRLTGMIRIQHRQLALVGIHRRDKQFVVDLNFDRPKPRSNFTAHRFAIDNVSAFDRDDLAFCDIGLGK